MRKTAIQWNEFSPFHTRQMHDFFRSFSTNNSLPVKWRRKKNPIDLFKLWIGLTLITNGRSMQTDKNQKGFSKEEKQKCFFCCCWMSVSAHEINRISVCVWEKYYCIPWAFILCIEYEPFMGLAMNVCIWKRLSKWWLLIV